MAAMTTILGWSDFERRRPDLAEAGRGLLYEDAFYLTGRAAVVGDESLARAATAQFPGRT
jgi:hypothetical protein